MRKITALLLSLLGGAAILTALFFGLRGSSASAQSNQAPNQARPFTATRTVVTFRAQEAIPIATETKTIAVRSDGSHVEIWPRKDPTAQGRAFYLRKIADVPNGRRIIVEPWGESITTYPMGQEAARFFGAKAQSECEGVDAGRVWGFSVSQTNRENTLSQGTGPGPTRRVKTQEWFARELNCYPIRRETRILEDEVVKQTVIETVVSVVEGEPDPSLFQIPSAYVERSPTAAMAEAERRYPELGCGACTEGNQIKDDIYFDAQRRGAERAKRR